MSKNIKAQIIKVCGGSLVSFNSETMGDTTKITVEVKRAVRVKKVKDAKAGKDNTAKA